MPEPLNYATPDLNKKVSIIDGIPLVLGLVQLLFVPLLAPFENSGLWFGRLSTNWYEWPGQLWISPICSTVVYALASCAVVVGAIKVGEKRLWWYWVYVCIFVASAVLKKLALLDLSPWPGERRFRWILIHNLRDTFVPSDSFWNFPVTSLMMNPAIWFLVVRYVTDWCRKI